MRSFFKHSLRLLVVLAAAATGLSIHSVALAQSSCSQLTSALRTLERNRDFRNGQNSSGALRALQQQLQQTESTYVRSGCNQQVQSGQPLSRQCSSLARDIRAGRAEVQDLSRSVETGQSVAAQRENILQEIARFGCNTRSNVTVEGGEPPRRRNFLEQLFDTFGGREYEEPGQDSIYEDPNYGWQSRSTVRSVCVRIEDGFFWPISFSTLPEYLSNDAAQCEAQCPGKDVELYYYANPGEEVEQMISMSGTPYVTLPTAFKYRQQFNPDITCKTGAALTGVQVADASGDGFTAAAAEMGLGFGVNTSFPLPKRDPRGVVRQIVTAEAQTGVNVPLPRRRPGTLPPGAPQPTVVAGAPDTRTVVLGDKTIRVVGPDTPYARLGAAKP